MSAPMATPGSPAESGNQVKPNIPKNKTCPFCGDHFTSSSLGRHLDLFIKEKNPKHSDGVHDVEAIREMRNNITRRQPRRSAAKREASESSSNKPSAALPEEQSSRTKSPSEEGRTTSALTWFRKPAWEASGVITDIPATSDEARFDTSRKGANRSEAVMKKRIREDRSRLRAAELALQEILDSIKSANTQTNPPSPFEYDFLGQTFPALCLRMLPKPPTICAGQVIENSKSWPVKAPGQMQFESLRQQLSKRLEEFEKDKARDAERREGSEDNPIANGQKEDRKEDFSPYYAHLSQAYDAWVSTSEPKKTDMWHLESLRAFAREKQEHEETLRRLAGAEAEAAHLRLQVRRLNECQQPQEFLSYPPQQFGVSRPTANLVTDAANTPLEREALIAKWAERVKANTSFQRSLPSLTDAVAIPEVTMTEPMNGVEIYATSAAAATAAATSTVPNGESVMDQGAEGDSADAAGEDDDDDIVVASSQPHLGAGSALRSLPVMDGGVLDPTLRGQAHAMEVDGGDFGAEYLLANMNARLKATNGNSPGTRL